MIGSYEYRESLVRDMAWLFNSVGIVPMDGPFEWIVELVTGTTQAERDRWVVFKRAEVERQFFLAQYSEARNSVINYGLRHITSLPTDPHEIARQLSTAILAFEPRILPNTLRVGVERDGFRMNVRLEFEYWAIPVPEALFLDTIIDLQEDRATIRVQR